ncbi:hypothetical protein QW131_08330 [Roseibium salinum]|nr:hypothetical protein [Roseibium salinum]
METDNGRRTLGQWWANYARKLPELRDFLISDLGGRTALARAAVSDLQSSEPLPAKRHGVLGDVTPFCSIETALTSEDGVLVGGWLRDPAGMYVGLDLIDPSGEAHPLSLHSFDGVLPDSQGGHRIKRFVAYAPVAKSLQHHLQPRFDLRLASGESFILIPPAAAGRAWRYSRESPFRCAAPSCDRPGHGRMPVAAVCRPAVARKGRCRGAGGSVDRHAGARSGDLDRHPRLPRAGVSEGANCRLRG